MATAALPNGVISSYVYDALGRLQTLSHARDGDLLSAFTYSYDPAGNRLETTETMLWVQAGGSVPPEQFSAVEQGYLAIALAWPDSTVDEEGYTLERSTDGGQHWQAIAELDANTLRYVDYGLARYTRYDYRLVAHNSQGGSQVQTAQAQTGGTGQFTTESRSVAITYGYDPLNRLTAADYSDGSYYHYAYDANGNRLTQDISGSISNTYVYDSADRLTSVDGVAYTWDDNGNLLGDGVNTYSYDHANRLMAVDGGSSGAEYAYNGLGDRLRETRAGVTTEYTLDLEAGLTQVLADGTNVYLYGVGRVAQESAGGVAYFHGDALGSCAS